MIKELNLIWKRKTARYQNGVGLYLPIGKVGSVDYEVITEEHREMPYRVMCSLPNMDGTPRFKDEESGQRYLAKIVLEWFNKAVELKD